MNKRDILELMKLKGWSQADLAAELGLFESTVSRWVRGLNSPIGRTRTLLRQWLEQARAEAEAKKQPA